MSTTRREFLAAGAALAATPALAKATLGGNTTPTYRFRIGDIEIAAFSDGYFDATTKVFVGVDPAEASRLLERDFRAPGPALRINLNAFVVNTGDKLILVDSGGGGAAPTVGKLAERLAAAGYKPEDFDAVVMTHLHFDHVGGLHAAPDTARFPNAEFIVSAREVGFWQDDAMMAKAPKDMQSFFQTARAPLKTYAKALRTFDKDGEVLKGVAAVALPGHTPGHTGYLISSGPDSALLWGDIVHSPSIQFAHPETTIVFDVDPAQAAATRKALLDRVSADRTLVAGAHMDFPAFAHVERTGDGYRAAPQPWRLD